MLDAYNAPIAMRSTTSGTEIMLAAIRRFRRSLPMLRVVRAGLAAALLVLVVAPSVAAEKPFKQSTLDQAAIKLEAQIKSDAGTVTKPAAALRRDADAAFQKNDFRTGMLVLGQLVTVAPDDASSWLRLGRTILQLKPRDDREKALLLDRASTAAYIAYQRAGDRNLEADSCVVNMKSCAQNMGSGCSISLSTPTPFHRAPVSSFPRSCPAAAWISRRLLSSRAWTGPQLQRATSNSAWRASSTVNAIQ
jgi:hypothetical protein